MATKEFDEKFQKLFTEMVEIAFEYLNFNKDEVDAIYIYASMEEGDFFYNVFYKINNKISKKHLVNNFLKIKIDVSSERQQSMLSIGNKYLESISKIFKGDEREVPTLMKMEYHPKTGKFNNDISYDLHYSNHPTRTAVDGFEEWFVEMGGKL
jgi:hypothetical protein